MKRKVSEEKCEIGWSSMFTGDIQKVANMLQDYADRYPGGYIKESFELFSSESVFVICVDREETDEEYAIRLAHIEANRASEIRYLKGRANALGLEIKD